MNRLLRLIISAYQHTLGTVLPNSCRFSPTCSHYAQEAIVTHGAARGSWLALRRLARCHPFHAGGYDPVPEAEFDHKDTKTRSRARVPVPEAEFNHQDTQEPMVTDRAQGHDRIATGSSDRIPSTATHSVEGVRIQ